MKKLLALTLLGVGCTPMDAEVTGHWWVWLAANSSQVVAEEALPDLEEKATIIECTPDRGWDPEEEEYLPTYIGPTSEDEADAIIGGDPRGWCGEDDEDADFDDPDHWDDGCEDAAIATIEECPNLWRQESSRRDDGPTEFYTFLWEDGIYALRAPLEPWRTEAVINGEGDLQFAVHHRLASGEDGDFRFEVAIDPDFEPVTCLSNESGNGTQIVQVDGENWLDKWSEDEDGYRIYYLNAGAYQVKQARSATDNVFWYMITDWSAGFAYARFAGEEFYSQPTAYGNYNIDGAGNHGFDFTTDEPGFIGLGATERTDLFEELNPSVDEGLEDEDEVLRISYEDLPEDYKTAYDERIDHVQDLAVQWQNELRSFGGAYADTECSGDSCDCSSGVCFETRVETNTWRPIDEQLSGLDGWMEVHSSWVRIKNSSKIEDGGSAEGDFQILFKGALSNSVLLVKGTFVIENIRKDPWAYPELEEVKRNDTSPEHQGQQYCK